MPWQVPITESGWAVGRQRAKGQEMKRQVFVSEGNVPHRFSPGTGVAANHCAQSKQQGRERAGGTLGYPKGGPSSLWGRGVASTHSLGKQLRNRILNIQIKKQKNLKTQRNGTTFGPVISLLGISEKTVQCVEKHA